LLVPSTVVLLGRWNWWPSKMSRSGPELPGAPGDDEPDAPLSAQVHGSPGGS
jgi:hypothetical protein